MSVGWLLCLQVAKLLFLSECTVCGLVPEAGAGWPATAVPPGPGRRLLGAAATGGEEGPHPAAGHSPASDNTGTGRAPQRPAGIPHMWSERQHNQRIHAHPRDGKPLDHHHHPHPPPAPPPPPLPVLPGADPSGPGQEETENRTGAIPHSIITFDHVQEGASHSGKPEVAHRKQDPSARKLHRMGGINDILKRPGMDPEITGDANLNRLSVMRLSAMNLTQLLAAVGDPTGSDGADANLTARQLRRKLRRQRLSMTDARLQPYKHGHSRYSLVTTRVRTRAKRSDTDLSDDYTWAVIVGGSGLAILSVVMCACVCARCNGDRKLSSEAALTPLPTDTPPTPAVFFVGGTHQVGAESAPCPGAPQPDTGLENSGFALGDLGAAGGGRTGGGDRGGAGGGFRHHVGCHLAGRGATAGPSTSTFGYSALKDDEDCVSLRSTTMEMEKS